MEPENRILMMTDARNRTTSELVSHSIDDDSFTRLRETALNPRFITLTADYRYLIVVGTPIPGVSQMDHRNDTIYVMDLLNGKYQFRGCDIVIDKGGHDEPKYNHHQYYGIRGNRDKPELSYGVSCKWNDGEISIIVGGYLRKMYESTQQNGCIVPEVVHNIIVAYIPEQEMLHCSSKRGEEHFAISIDDILLS